MRASVSDLREPLLVLPAELVEVADVADGLGPAPREEALDVVPVGLLAVEHGRLHHHGQSQLTLEIFQQSQLRFCFLCNENQIIPYVQGDPSGWSQPPVDIKTNVAFQLGCLY